MRDSVRLCAVLQEIPFGEAVDRATCPTGRFPGTFCFRVSRAASFQGHLSCALVPPAQAGPLRVAAPLWP